MIHNNDVHSHHIYTVAKSANRYNFRKEYIAIFVTARYRAYSNMYVGGVYMYMYVYMLTPSKLDRNKVGGDWGGV